MGDAYVDKLFAAFAGRVPAEADLVCYWFAKGWERLCAVSPHPHPALPRMRGRMEEGVGRSAGGGLQRVGLVATNSKSLLGDACVAMAGNWRLSR